MKDLEDKLKDANKPQQAANSKGILSDGGDKPSGK